MLRLDDCCFEFVASCMTAGSHLYLCLHTCVNVCEYSYRKKVRYSDDAGTKARESQEEDKQLIDFFCPHEGKCFLKLKASGGKNMGVDGKPLACFISAYVFMKLHNFVQVCAFFKLNQVACRQ